MDIALEGVGIARSCPPCAPRRNPGPEERRQPRGSAGGKPVINGRLAEFVLDFELDFLTEAAGLRSLHYGIWRPDDPPTLAGLRQAQARYTHHLHGFIPAGVTTILDVGSGLGDNAHFLASQGYIVTAFSPTPSHARFYTGPDAPVEFHTASLQTFPTERRFDLVLMSETSNYFPIDAAFERVDRWLAGGGYLLVSGLFRRAGAVRFSQRHTREGFIGRAQAGRYEVIHDQNVTADVLPTIDLAREYLSILLGGLAVIDRYRKDPRCPWPLRAGLLIASGLSSRLTYLGSLLRRSYDMMDRGVFQENHTYRFILFRRQPSDDIEYPALPAPIRATPIRAASN
jgi:MPBQ/MSBQ methyltransferase